MYGRKVHARYLPIEAVPRWQAPPSFRSAKVTCQRIAFQGGREDGNSGLVKANCRDGLSRKC